MKKSIEQIQIEHLRDRLADRMAYNDLLEKYEKLQDELMVLLTEKLERLQRDQSGSSEDDDKG